VRIGVPFASLDVVYIAHDDEHPGHLVDFSDVLQRKLM
jgi:hypothetical protein